MQKEKSVLEDVLAVVRITRARARAGEEKGATLVLARST
jgi:hypothetical protein